MLVLVRLEANIDVKKIAFAILIMLIFYPIPDKNAQIFLAIAGFVMGFYFGSSTNKQRPPAQDNANAN